MSQIGSPTGGPTQRVFIDACTIGDIVVDVANPKKLKGFKDATAM
jgi:hypothetical protein